MGSHGKEPLQHEHGKRFSFAGSRRERHELLRRRFSPKSAALDAAVPDKAWCRMCLGKSDGTQQACDQEHVSAGSRHGRVFWIMKLKAVKLNYQISNIREVMQLCVPRACSLEVAGGFLAPFYLYHGLRSGTLQLPQDLLGTGCYGNPDTNVLPLRLAVAVDQHAEFQQAVNLGAEAARELRKTWLIHFQEKGLHPIIYTALEQPRLPSPRHHSRAGLAEGLSQGAAVLFAGDWRFDEGVVASIQRHLVRPLQARVFAVISWRRQRRGWAERRAMKKLVPSLTDFLWVLDDSEEDLRRKIQPSALQRYQRMGGRALAPLGKHSRGGSLHSLVKLQKVLDLTEAHEMRRGFRFRWLIYSRLDLVWVSHHPLLKLLDEKSIWTVPLAGKLQQQTNGKARSGQIIM